MVPNTLPGVDAHLDEEGLSVAPMVVCGECKRKMERVGADSYTCSECGEKFSQKD
ncbi:MAG TPA: hypothetical protein VJB08_06445 [Candidatus Nanoarchaeia archaeon]|nr:hypothetical protein [Candidatus Nanoarchaeia archaeon]